MVKIYRNSKIYRIIKLQARCPRHNKEEIDNEKIEMYNWNDGGGTRLFAGHRL